LSGPNVAYERREFACALRQHPTRAEDILWRSRRGSGLEGAKFRRQVPIDRYAVDFYCHAAKLVVDLDGKQHECSETVTQEGAKSWNDSASGSFLTNEEVCGDLDSSLGLAPNCVYRSTKAPDPLAPAPFPMGEGSRLICYAAYNAAP